MSEDVTVDVHALAAGGDGVARDDNGRVTFVPLAAPGDRVRVRLVKQTKSFARGELVEIVTPSPERVVPPCVHFTEGCGGCQWQHVAMASQVAAKQAIVTAALRRVITTIEPIVTPAPPLGWRRRARFHVEDGKLGLYHRGTNKILPLAHCPQLEPKLEAVLELLVEMMRTTPIPEGELAMLLGHRGDIVIGIERPWKAAPTLIGQRGIVGVIAEESRFSKTVIEVEPGLNGSVWDFAQASSDGNTALISIVRAALGKGPGTLLELYAGAGNLTRGFIVDGWSVIPTDRVEPRKPPPNFIAGNVERVVRTFPNPFDAIVLDPPRQGAAEAIDSIIRLAPKKIVYVSCDPATLARDAEKLIAAGYVADGAWPLDLMPQTSHVEVVLRLVKP
jgi:23S rRNA (uracil1939-C5)-methyltransferase